VLVDYLYIIDVYYALFLLKNRFLVLILPYLNWTG